MNFTTHHPKIKAQTCDMHHVINTEAEIEPNQWTVSFFYKLDHLPRYLYIVNTRHKHQMSIN